MLRLALTVPLRLTQQIKSELQNNAGFVKKQFVREFSRDSRPGVTRSRLQQGQTLKEKLMGPPGANAYSIGKGAAAVGMGALCYYGVGLGSPTNIQHNSIDKIHTTYGYFGASVALTAASAVAVFRTSRLLNLVTRNGWMSMLEHGYPASPNKIPRWMLILSSSLLLRRQLFQMLES